MTDKLAQYRELLLIRQKGKRRDVILVGGVFWAFFVAFIFLGLTRGMTDRAIYLITGIEVVFLVAYLMAWVRLEKTNAMIELLSKLLDQEASLR